MLKVNDSLLLNLTSCCKINSMALLVIGDTIMITKIKKD
jgi:hypothetical protein